MKKYFYWVFPFVIVLLTSHVSGDNSFNPKCRISIYIDKYESIYTLYNPVDTFKKSRSVFLIFTKKDCKGSVAFKEYTKINAANIRTLEGNYIANRDTSVIQDVMVDIVEEIMRKDTFYYYIPAKNGIWSYYNTTGILVKKEIYENGVLIK